jgi:putative ABC transport system ATP-binding protein
MIRLKNIIFSWPNDSVFRLVVPSFSIKRGEKILLLGESGSGKSTILSLISGIVSPIEGKIILEGTDLASLGPLQRDRMRAEHMGIIFQQFNLLPFMSLYDNIALPLAFAPKRKRTIQNAHREITRICTALGLKETLLENKASTLSVGQQQRVAVARALIGSPKILLADEPTSSLDSQNKNAFLKLLFQEISKNRTSLLMVSHDQSIKKYFDRYHYISDITCR